MRTIPSFIFVAGVGIALLLYLLLAAYQGAGQVDAENKAAIRLLAEFHIARASRTSELDEYVHDTDELVAEHPHVRAIQDFGRLVRSGARGNQPK